MRVKLTDKIAKSLPLPGTGNRITYDDEVKGFGVRVTAAGARSFVFGYRTRTGRQRRFTIGDFSVTGTGWGVGAARAEAERLKVMVRGGADPLAELEADRTAPTMKDLADRIEEELLPRRRAGTAGEYRRLIRLHILPALRHLVVADVTYTDIANLHRNITRGGSPYAANRTMSLLSKMFTEAIKWEWRSTNPTKGVERNIEEPRHRYLSGTEVTKLTAALAALPDQQAANILRLLLLTGARKGEVLTMRWDQLDLAAGVWTKPPASTKQKAMHRVPLSPPARQVLLGVREAAEALAKAKGEDVTDYVFPGRGSPHRVDVKKDWAEACVAAGIVTATKVKTRDGDRAIATPSARIHDLRHTYASLLASSGMSLPIIGALLGHTQPSTTARYAHLLDDPLRLATERVGAIVSPSGPTAEVVPFPARH